ncbi:MAG: ATP-binding protein [Thermoanaerobaculia bacterium]
MKAARRERLLNRYLLIGITVTFAILVANTLVSRDGLNDQRGVVDLVNDTQEVLRELDGVASSLYQAEADQRALVLMNDETYDEPYRAASRAFLQHIDRVELLVADNPPQLARTRRLAELAQKRLKQLDGVIETSRESGLMAARQTLLRNGNKETTASIRELATLMEAEESRLLEERLNLTRTAFRRAQRLNLYAGTLGLLALASFVVLVERNLRSRQLESEEIARHREVLRVTLVSIGDAVITTDSAARVTFLNSEAERLTAWTTEAAAGKPLDRIFRILNATTRETVESPALRALREGKVVAMASDTILLAQDGRELPIDDSAAPIRDADGVTSGVVLVFRDVTEERAASAQLRSLAAELAEADQRKNEFLAILAHEIRNPLAAIRTSVTLLQRAGEDPQAAKTAMGAIDRQMRHLVRLVEDLLDVARISRGKLALQRARMDLRQALEQAIEASRPLCDEAEQALEVEIPDHPMLVDGDGVRIAQAISNLLSNACKFSSRGGKIRLSVGIEASHAIVRIRDTGIGIAAEHLPRLFDMFTQVENGLERTQGGLGIGLNLVKQLVEMHGGRVEARSEGAGKGSEFIVHFPLLAATEPAVAASLSVPGDAAQVVTASQSAADGPTRLRILVVDDNVDSAESLAMLLRLEGHQTLIAHDGLEAVAIALRELPEVVLLDIGLPGLNGYEAAARIREQSQAQPMRLIALTGWGQEADRQRSREAGFDQHLVKPVDADALIALLASPTLNPKAT